jgi:membrane protein implicated in regulation of membrane protease activity
MESRHGEQEAARARWIEVEEGERDEVEGKTTSREEKVIRRNTLWRLAVARVEANEDVIVMAISSNTLEVRPRTPPCRRPYRRLFWTLRLTG